MREIHVVNHLTFDGVMQAPASASEDDRGGFTKGGWAVAGNDAVMGRAMAQGMGRQGAILLGRRTYEQFASVWPKRADAYADTLTRTTKYVATRAGFEPEWENTYVLAGDAAVTVSQLTRDGEGSLTVLGSGELIAALLAADLIDRWTLMIHPLVLGTGRRLFGDSGPPASLRLTETVTTTTGVIIASYARG
jgi:dihydrofolate reductase